MSDRTKSVNFQAVSVEPCEGGFAVTLDRRRLMTPMREPIVLPTRALAEAVAAEWRLQNKKIQPATMPLTRIVFTALDRVAAVRAEVIEELTAYAGTDLLCYRADQPEDLVRRQEEVWQPLLDWLAERFQAPLVETRGIVPLPQPAESLAALSQALHQLDNLRLSAVAVAVVAAGSLAIGLALAESRLDAAGAFAAAELDATHQAERWGEDPEAARGRAEIRADLEAAEQFLRLLSQVR